MPCYGVRVRFNRYSNKSLFWHAATTHAVLSLMAGLCHAHFLGGENLVLKSEVLQINLNLIQRYIAISRFWIQCLFFQKNFHAHFFGQIWSPIVMFSKLLEIWYRGTLLYAYYNSNFYFSKILVTNVFLVNLVPWSRFFQIDWSFVEG